MRDGNAVEFQYCLKFPMSIFEPPAFGTAYNRNIPRPVDVLKPEL